MSGTRISVIVPTYQHARTLRATLDSIFSQTLRPYEIIVVNDGSTDGTGEILASYVGKIRVINQPNRGGNPARNAGFEASTGAYVLFCDADVIMRPDMLERMAELLDAHPEAGYVYAGFRFGWKKFRSFPFSESRLRRMNFIHTTSLIRRSDFPGFDASIRRLQDWDVWLTMLERGKLGLFVDEELFVIQDEHGRRGISQWRPSIMYWIPWKRLGWKPESMRRYDEAFDVIAKKHGL